MSTTTTVKDETTTATQVLSFDNIDSIEPNTDYAKPHKNKHKRQRRTYNATNDLDYTITNKIKDKQQQYISKDINQLIVTQETHKNNKPNNYDDNDIKKIKSKKLQNILKYDKQRNIESTHSNAIHDTFMLPGSNGYIETNNDIIQTWQLKQSDIYDNLDMRTQNKRYNIDNLEYGSYIIRYTRNGRYMLLCGQLGHISIIDTHNYKLIHEFVLDNNEYIYDSCYLHNHSMYAVSQRKYVYIYDNNGLELHCLQNHLNTRQIQYLPYHFLLSSIGVNGILKYQDISTGQFIIEHKTKKGDCNLMKQNRNNAIIHCGHNNGEVTLWSPNMSQSLVNIYTHRSRVTALDITLDGHYMVTSGLDQQVKIWDLRTYKCVNSYFSRSVVNTMQLSDNNILALGYGTHVETWKDICSNNKQQSPYLTNKYPGHVINVCVILLLYVNYN